MAFITPIWRACCASSADTVLMSKNALRSREVTPSAVSRYTSAWKIVSWGS